MDGSNEKKSYLNELISAKIPQPGAKMIWSFVHSGLNTANNFNTFKDQATIKLGHYEYNATVIPEGVVVHIFGIRCDGKIDCWNGNDEDMCGFNTFVTFGAGNLLHFH